MKPIPDNLPREEAFTGILERLHRRWRFAILIPLVYLVAGYLVLQYWFLPERLGKGFAPMPEGVYMALLLIGAGLCAVLWRALTMRVRGGLLELSEEREDPNRFLTQASEQQLLHFAVCDLASVPGIILFLMQGTALPLLVFCLFSLVLYLRVMPSARLLGEAFFRPDLLKRET